MSKFKSLLALTLVGAAMQMAVVGSAEARIRCDGPFQIIPNGGGTVATSFCESEYLAYVARKSFGMRVTARAIRRSFSKKEEACHLAGHDSRVYDICHQFRNDGGRKRY